MWYCALMAKAPWRTEQHFWNDIDKTGGCWEWKKSCSPKGYGRTYWQGKAWFAHRLAWVLTYGEIPEGMRVLHTECDNPPCCRPSHLKLGTVADNQREMMLKGRSKAKHWTEGGNCVNGHPWETNARFMGRHRRCLACKNAEQRLRRARV